MIQKVLTLLMGRSKRDRVKVRSFAELTIRVDPSPVAEVPDSVHALDDVERIIGNGGSMAQREKKIGIRDQSCFLLLHVALTTQSRANDFVKPVDMSDFFFPKLEVMSSSSRPFTTTQGGLAGFD
ncbi:hypothetical protein OUZ56_004548 [Daphnia magna]|uniref:K Homology domain-containing protein n=1 Tax=Daphnia magna TaxID=35525 RepID=A0ABQ9YQ51_9CRUS|nr:hypothetical protein OUZ56_004548 [Daphnia magna]